MVNHAPDRHGPVRIPAELARAISLEKEADPSSVHTPVLADEVVRWLDPQPGNILVDGTVGGGGHARMLAERVGPDGLIVALDRDPAAIATAAKVLAGLPVKLAQTSFAELPELLGELKIESVDGVLLDLGLSSDQLADRERGFSFDSPGPLDLRFDPTSGEPAWRLVNRLSVKRLADLIYRYGEERFSRRIARKIVQTRQRRPIRTSAELAELIRRTVPNPKRRRRLHPATRTFQALRIAVNDELGALDTALCRIPDSLRPDGRLAIISFHSLEDRSVKKAFRSDDRLTVLTGKPVRPSQAEVRRNVRSRSAKLRVAERIGG